MNIALLNHFEEESPGFYSGLVQRAKRENLKDILNRLKRCGLFDKIVLQTNIPSVFEKYTDTEIHETSKITNFGKRLNLILKKYPECRLFYTGSGSSVFLTPEKIRKYITAVRYNSVIANNLYSADCFFMRTSKSRFAIDNISTDNSLPRFLIENYNLQGIEIKRDEFSLFDIDGPLDLLALKISGRGGPNLSRFLKNTDITNKNVINAMRIFTQRTKEIL
ncbi:MAG: hypothetical protein N3B13_05690, partial [Deltaproteobacteria bacterium]|nr:hypothetical protein [Deltaproteobacteria bacterium]